MFYILIVSTITGLVFIDQITKQLVVNNLMNSKPIQFLFGLFQLRYVENTGAAFSILSKNTDILSIFTIIILLVCFVYLLKSKNNSKFINLCLTLIISGGIGNVIDRITNGYVVDYIEPLFINFAVFNFADICITVGAFMLIGYEIYEIFKEKKHE